MTVNVADWPWNSVFQVEILGMTLWGLDCQYRGPSKIVTSHLPPRAQAGLLQPRSVTVNVADWPWNSVFQVEILGMTLWGLDCQYRDPSKVVTSHLPPRAQAGLLQPRSVTVNVADWPWNATSPDKSGGSDCISKSDCILNVAIWPSIDLPVKSGCNVL